MIGRAGVLWRLGVCLLGLCFFGSVANGGQTKPKLRVLALGGSGGSHRTAEMIRLASPRLASAGVALTYSEDVASTLGDESLAHCDCLFIYKDDGELPPEAERSLLAYLRQGGGLVAVHCASHAFRNSDAYTRLIGGRFHHHGTGEFRSVVVDAQHAITQGWRNFSTWDETYVHDQLANDNRVLAVRAEDGGYEPYAWVRGLGRGRIFYTALGHDERTWGQPEFTDLLARAARWAAAAADEAPAAEELSVEQYTHRALTTEPPQPLAPEDSMRRMHLPEGFAVRLFATEPDIVKPLTMAEDERGRVWVVESVDYPNDVLEPFAGHDRIKICEDTDGDGRADRFTVFADGLNIPTSLLPYRDGVLVALAPHIVHLRDTDGDLVADRRDVLYTGFGKMDTHAVHSNFRWGMDNWVWATVGYSGGEVTAGGETHRFKQGVIRFKPDGSKLEVLTSTSNNTWGLGFRETGEVFVSTANNQHSVHLAIPNRYFEQVRGWHGMGWAEIEDHKQMHPVGHDLRQVDSYGGYTAAAGQTIYTAAQFPPAYRDRAALVCEPTGHLVHIDWLTPRGSGYVARDGFNLLASDDPWTAPIETQMALDGSVWMIDWYNYIVRHNPTPPGFETGAGNAYITPQRDKSHGRIYRIHYGDAPPAAAGLASDNVAGLIAALASDNMAARLHAQRLLYERGKTDIAAQWTQLVAADGVAAPHALGLLTGLEVERREWSQALDAALRSKKTSVRMAALAALARDATCVERLLASGALDAEQPTVCLAALLTLAEMPASDDAARALAGLLRHDAVAKDRWLPTAAIAAAARCDLAFLLAAAVRDKTAAPPALAEAVRVVSRHWAAGDDHARIGELVVALSSSEPAIAGAAIGGLAGGWSGREAVELNEEQLGALNRLMGLVDVEGQLTLAKLTQQWGIGDAFAEQVRQVEAKLVEQAADAERDDDKRIEAVRQLVAMARHDEALRRLTDLITPRSSPALVAGILDALATSSRAEIGELLIECWPRLTPTSRTQAVATLLRRSSWTARLLDAVARGTVSADDLSADQWQNLVHHPEAALAQRAKKLSAGNNRLPSEDRQRVLSELLPIAERRGDVTRGKLVFEQNCAKCHRHGDLGERIGPDLTGMAVRPRAEILTDVLDPNRSVEGNFRQYVVTTTDGLILTGLLLAETKTSVELLDSQAKRHVVQRDEIDEFAASPLSVMPEGFEKLPADDLAALLEFLSVKGRFVPLSIAKAATAISTRGMFYSREADAERLVFDDWGTKRVDEAPFQLVDPQGDRTENIILLYSPASEMCRRLPTSVTLDCNTAATKIHLLSGVSGWGYPVGMKGSVSLIVRLHYADGSTEDHELKNGEHFADYIRVVDVPKSQLAFKLREQQIRYLAVAPARPKETIAKIEFVKGPDQSAPVVMAVTVERDEN
ncbi:MAG: ThuA domain-containing protein [Pirellulales bacterium]|nr:ThuA domain-containing protein [Pirellulales bacterium]